MNKSIADFVKPTIITAQQYGTKVSVELNHSDTDIDELMDAFHTLVIGLGYHDSAWKEWIVDRADEYKEEAAEEVMYEPSPELRRAAEAYVNLLAEKDIDEALAEHNADEEDDEYDDYGRKIEPNEALKKAAENHKKNKKK
jgi:hypothetical protein